MHLALADWRFLCLNQNRFSFIAQLLKALESAVASSFSLGDSISDPTR